MILIDYQPVFVLPLFYLDPGSGSFIIQLLLAAALGIGVAARMYWSKIRSIFGKKDPARSETENETDEE